MLTAETSIFSALGPNLFCQQIHSCSMIPSRYAKGARWARSSCKSSKKRVKLLHSLFLASLESAQGKSSAIPLPSCFPWVPGKECLEQKINHGKCCLFPLLYGEWLAYVMCRVKPLQGSSINIALLWNVLVHSWYFCGWWKIKGDYHSWGLPSLCVLVCGSISVYSRL